MIDFLFKKDVDFLFSKKIRYNGTHDSPLGFSIKNLDYGFVNLSSPLFKLCVDLGEDFTIQEISRVISHETIHLCLKELGEKYCIGEEITIEKITSDS